jgi:DNA-directed RNA polymerase sigma subunit (sigma70/sigma32)
MYNERLIRLLLDKGVTERELEVVLDRTRGVSLAHIAKDEGVTPERIRQIESRAHRKIGKILRPHGM